MPEHEVTKPGTRRALIVANQEYADNALQRLRAPVHDAEDLAGVLRNPDIGSFDVVTVFNDPSYRVRRTIQEFLASATRDDILFLYFSCHGLKDDAGRLFLATTDTEVQWRESTSIESSFVNEQVRRSRARCIVVVLDCCYSGAFGAGTMAKAGDPVGVEDYLELGRGRLWLSSSNALEYSFEGGEVGSATERSGLVDRSIFTAAMVEGLRTGDADRNGDGFISFDELYDYVFERVSAVTPNQHPRRGGELEGSVYIARNPSPPKPRALPPEVVTGLESPSANVRRGAVDDLRKLLKGSDHRLRLAAAEALQHVISDDDSLMVRTAASSALGLGEGATAGSRSKSKGALRETPPGGGQDAQED